MAETNPHFERLKAAYIFPIIEKKLKALQDEHPNQHILNLGVGDVCLPLAPKIAETIKEAVDEMARSPIGYGPCGGYGFLKEAIWKDEYRNYGISPEEIFVSDGANTDASAIQNLFSKETVVAITDPSYPVYRDATLLSGKKLHVIPLKEEQGFLPMPPSTHVDLVYLCTPSNPTGVALSRGDLKTWVEWAKETGSTLIFDNVYHAFISSDAIAPSIYDIEGAQEVAIEVRSFSKMGGFTGLRCGYTVVPHALHIPNLSSLWQKHIDIHTNGISYPIQKGAEACFTDDGKRQLQAQIETYKTSGTLLRKALTELDQTFYGGEHAPYIWWKTPQELSSWEFFDQLLERSRILSIPGSGFGNSGEGFVRLSCFLSTQLATEAAHALHHHFATV